MYIKRNLEDTILQYLDSPKIIAVVGPRQSGKTTKVFKNAYPDIDVLFSYKDVAKDVLSEKGVYPIYFY